MQTLAKGEESQQKPWKSRSLGMPGLGLIEKDRGSRSQEVFRNGHSGTDPHAITQREEIKLVQRLFLAPGQRSPRTVLFSGVEADGGCASICARVGYTLAAQTDGPVCVVDTNFRSPSLHQYFGVDNFRGLAEAILQPGPLQEFAQRLPERGLLWVIPSGFKVAKLSFSAVPDRLRSRMAELRAAFKFVVVHSSPLTADTDSVLLSRCTDGVVLVVEANSTRRETARRVKENLEVADVPVLGVVLNNRTFPIPEALYRRL
jgi:Mrp family chromosome partitioning ATPase